MTNSTRRSKARPLTEIGGCVKTKNQARNLSSPRYTRTNHSPANGVLLDRGRLSEGPTSRTVVERSRCAGPPASIPGYSKQSPSGCAGFSRSSRCQRWWRVPGAPFVVNPLGFMGEGGEGRCIRRPFADCLAGCLTHLPFPCFPCSFVWPLVRNTWTLKEPKAPGPDNANSTKSKIREFADRGRLRSRFRTWQRLPR